MSLEENAVEEEVEVEEAEVVEPELDDDGNPIEAEETPLFMQLEEEEEEQTTSEQVPLSALMKQKKKTGEGKEEIERLKAELAEAKKGGQQAQELKRPRAADFADADDPEAELEDALEKYDQQRDSMRVQRQGQVDAAENNRKRIDAAEEEFTGRADKLIAKHKINPDEYLAASDVVRGIIEEALPKLGKNAFKMFLANLEDGDEATIFTIGKNKGQQKILAELLSQDKTGIKALKHISRLTERNLGVKPKSSKAPKPAATVKGDTDAVPAKEGAWKKKYDKATGQQAYDIKKAARAAGVDTSKF